MPNECHETATVTKIISEDLVQVVVKRSEACGACAAKGACQALGGQTKDFFLELYNPIGAKVGDTVRLTISEAAVIKASAILYLLPAVNLILFALMGNMFAPQLGFSSDAAAVLGALIGLGIGFFATWLVSKRAEKNQQSVPIISRVMESEDR
ncbi:MAG: SoxR reducing system RseC family protein [Deltaproteobacteria bacterium]|nr:SoxR reducing system RseC family protein [Deltaproteobacteria bacterium]